MIPAMALPFSIVGTFSVMYLLNFSINNISMMALILSIGFVVDDAIVMLENIVRHIEHGEKPLQAALSGSREIGFTIVSMTLSLAAVFIPILFMAGILGRLFREFAVTLSITILVSGFVSLTLTPMMCARILKHQTFAEQSRFAQAAEKLFDRIIAFYERTLETVLEHQPLTLAVAIMTLLVTILLYIIIPKGFFPVQDTGVIQGIS